jgi:2-dehydro-3-deoxygalactonokinase
VPDTRLIALDWGTTALRAYRFDGSGQAIEARHRDAGVMRITGGDPAAGFARAFDEACGDWLSASPRCAVLACGMVGSAQGWREAPYLDVPVSLEALAGALTEVAAPHDAVLHIIPGLLDRQGPLPDVLRGEETQVAGAIDRAEAASGAETWFGLPGTHAKWIRVRDRRIIGFRTFMTGEVFDALCVHTILGRTMRRPAVPDDRAFDRGVAVAGSAEARAGVLSNAFSARTLGLVGELPGESQADYLSGLLIGHEIAALAQLGPSPASIVLIGRDDLCARYHRALAALGYTAAAIAAGATERGLWRVAEAAGLVGVSLLW